ncbi:alpha-amylase family glycosyl hydrolase [Thermodesulfobacteriota bacterium]
MIKRKNPHIYEINLMTWLYELSKRSQKNINLRNIPEEKWKYLKEIGMDFVWLMGMWHRSPYSMERAQEEPHLLGEFKNILDDFQEEDIAGSPYSIYDYVPDPTFGSFQDLIHLKESLESQGLGLILDFVPNHTACDFKLINRCPDLFIHGHLNKTGDCEPGFFKADTSLGRICIAHGKDPFFQPWTDTAQINYARKGARDEMSRILLSLSSMCQGLRCDMSMLLLEDVFRMTWAGHLEREEETWEFWPKAIDLLRSEGRPCLLLAEAYWGREEELLAHGFDYAYDKTLYDLMANGDISGLKGYLSGPINKQEKMLRFLENHDEPRALTTFGPNRIKCAMVIHATLPGMRLWQHGQLEGNKIKVPVQLRRAPEEPADINLRDFSENLLKQINHPLFHYGSWEVCETYGWPDNFSHKNLLAWCWRINNEMCLVISNFSSYPAQGYVKIPPEVVSAPEQMSFRDPLKGDLFSRSAEEVERLGLYVDLCSNDFHFFWVE